MWITQVVGPVEKIAPRTLNLMHGMFFASVRVIRTPFFLLTCDFLTGNVCDRSGQLGEYQPALRVISVARVRFLSTRMACHRTNSDLIRTSPAYCQPALQTLHTAAACELAVS